MVGLCGFHTVREELAVLGKEDVCVSVCSMFLLQHVKAVAKAGCNMVVTGGKVGEMALHFLNKHKIMVVRWASPSLSSPSLSSPSLSPSLPPSFSPSLPLSLPLSFPPTLPLSLLPSLPPPSCPFLLSLFPFLV